MAIAVALEHTDKSQDVAIFTDSEWVRRALLDWLPFWGKQDWKTSNGKPVAHQKKLLYVWKLAEQRKAYTKIGRVQAHQKNQTFSAQYNAQADALANGGAETGPMWKEPSDCTPVAAIQSENTGAVDLKALQDTDTQVQKN